MIDGLIAHLRERPRRAFSVPITLGYAIGRLRVGTITFGAVTGDGDEAGQSKRLSSGRPTGAATASMATIGLAVCIGAVTVTTPSRAQTASAGPSGETSQLLPADRQEIADQERLPSWTVNKIPPQPYMKEVYWNLPDDTPAFFRDSLVQFVARTYDLTRDNANGTRSQGWGSRRLAGVPVRPGRRHLRRARSLLHLAETLRATRRGGYRLLAPGQNSIGTLGQIYGRAQFGDQEFRGGYQLVDTPLINPQDNRMVPNTFGGITLDSLPDRDRNYDYALGYLWTIKERDSNDFIPMSDALAGDAVNHGAAFGMVKWRPISGLSTVFMDYHIQDYINSGFAQVEYDFKQPKTVPNWIVGANVVTQQSVGANLLTGSSFMTHQASAKLQMVYAGWTLFAAGSVTGNESTVFSPFGIRPTYTDMQQIAFENAGEKAFGGSVAYDFGTMGLPGVSTGIWYTRGWDAIDPRPSRPFPIAANSTSGFSTGRPTDL